MNQFIKYIILVLLVIIGVYFYNNAIVVGTITGIISFIIVESVEGLTDAFSNPSFFYSSKIRYRNSFIRLSMSYVIRIKCNDKYFLIKGLRLPNQYQPVGGVYKFYAGAMNIFKKLDVHDDDIIPVDSVSKNDLRIRVRGKHVLHFLKWFDSRIDRETSPLREFKEELVDSGILSKENFSSFDFVFLRRESIGIRYAEYVGGPELIMGDVFELLTNERQLDELNTLKKRRSKRFIWADADKIKRLGVVPRREFSQSISPTAIWLL